MNRRERQGGNYQTHIQKEQKVLDYLRRAQSASNEKEAGLRARTLMEAKRLLAEAPEMQAYKDIIQKLTPALEDIRENWETRKTIKTTGVKISIPTIDEDDYPRSAHALVQKALAGGAKIWINATQDYIVGYRDKLASQQPKHGPRNRIEFDVHENHEFGALIKIHVKTIFGKQVSTIRVDLPEYKRHVTLDGFLRKVAEHKVRHPNDLFMYKMVPSTPYTYLGSSHW